MAFGLQDAGALLPQLVGRRSVGGGSSVAAACCDEAWEHCCRSLFALGMG